MWYPTRCGYCDELGTPSCHDVTMCIRGPYSGLFDDDEQDGMEPWEEDEDDDGVD